MPTIPELFALALKSHQAGALSGASALYSQILEKDPGHADSWHLLGLIAHQSGQHERARDLIRAAIGQQSANALYYCNLGTVCRAMGDHEAAVASYRQALQIEPAYAEAHNFLGVSFLEQKRWDEARSSFQQALRLAPDYPLAHNNLGNLFKARGEPEQASACYRAALRCQPDFALAHNNLGSVYKDLGRLEDALSCFRQALQCQPDLAEAHYNLGGIFRLQGLLIEAVESFRRALSLAPNFARARGSLGNVLRQQGKLEEAIHQYREALRLLPADVESLKSLGSIYVEKGDVLEAVSCYREALRLRPEDADLHNNLGNVLQGQGNLTEALDCFQKALQLRGGCAEAHNNLGNLLHELGKVEEALDHYQSALALQPGCAEIHNNLGYILYEEGRLAEAAAQYAEALRLKPDFAMAHSNLLLCLSHDPRIAPERLFSEHCRWAAVHGTCSEVVPHGNDTTVERPLKVGYVSADFRAHAVSRFLEPILVHHDPEQVEVFCYANVHVPDAMTTQLRSLAPQWRFIQGQSDQQVVERIRMDRIDILVDLSGHTAGNRLRVFAHKPAPIQVTYLGYPGTTGLESIDYRLTDAILDPLEAPARYSEALVRLPHGYCCYLPRGDMPACTPLPAARLGRITFGSFHKLSKINEEVLDLWCRILQALPESRLLVMHHTLVNQARAALRRRFARGNITDERLELCQQTAGDDYLNACAQVDVGLDTFPWTGHAITCDVLWMGLPILTLAGNQAAGRLSASVLSQLGLQEWIAATPDELITRALTLTKNRNSLAELRATLRSRMSATLGNGKIFTRGLETIYRNMWRTWCARRRKG